jgi:MFS family permease
MTPSVWVAALGYFVDVYDLLIFSVVRVSSLRDLGFEGKELELGAQLNNAQMTGMLLGGVLWGMFADKKGRLSVLFGSILLYSIANFANGFVTTFEQYQICRFIAGVGLAGELGAGITLVAESLPVNARGIGTMIVATIGMAGAVVGGLVGQALDWRIAFILGGTMGLVLFFVRIGVVESKIFRSAKETSHSRGNFIKLFTSIDRFKRFIFCILVGVPTWFASGILVAYSPEFAKNFGVTGTVTAGNAVIFTYIGYTLGDFLSGWLSQWLQSRVKALKIFVIFNLLAVMFYLFGIRDTSSEWLYFSCFLLGTSGGYWAVMITVSAEQFGTNLRATVTTSVPNFIRFALVPMNFIFIGLKPDHGMIPAACMVGAGALGVAFLSAWSLKETFHRDLNFLES